MGQRSMTCFQIDVDIEVMPLKLHPLYKVMEQLSERSMFRESVANGL